MIDDPVGPLAGIVQAALTGPQIEAAPQGVGNYFSQFIARKRGRFIHDPAIDTMRTLQEQMVDL